MFHRFLIAVLITWISFSPNSSWAQSDNIEQQLAAMEEDSLKVDFLLSSAHKLRLIGKSKDADGYQLRGCALADTLGYRKGQINCLNGKGINFRNKGEFVQALTNHEKALEISRAIENNYLISICLNNIGTVYRRIDNIEKALEFHLESLTIARRMGNRRGVAVSLNSIGNIYLTRKENDKALETFEECIKIESGLNNRLGVAINLNNIGYIYDASGDFEKALDYYEQSLEVNKEINSQKGLSISYNDIGRIKSKLGLKEEALIHFHKALEINEQQAYRQYAVNNHINIGEVYYTENNTDFAIEHFQKGLSIALDLGTFSQIGECYDWISKTYEKRGDYRNTLEHFRESIRYKDSLAINENEKVVAQLLSKFEEENKELKIKELEGATAIQQAKIDKRRTTIIGLIIGVVLTLALLGVVYKNYKQKKKASELLVKQNKEIERQNLRIEKKNRSLESKNKDLIDLNLEKNNVLGIIAHDLRSPMNHIIGLTSIMEYGKESLNSDQAQSLDMISDTSVRMREMINRILDINAMDNKELNLQLESVNITKLLQKVIKQFIDSANKKNIVIESSLQKSIMSRLDKNYTIQVIENLLANAIKFSPRDKKVFVRLTKEDDKVCIEIEDQGQGIKKSEQHRLFEKFQILSSKPTAGEKSTGLGLYIVKTFVEAMGGNVFCESKKGEGAIFKVLFNCETNDMIPS